MPSDQDGDFERNRTGSFISAGELRCSAAGRRGRCCGEKPARSSTASSRMTGQRERFARIAKAGQRLAGFAEENGAVSAQHVNGGDDHAPEREDGGELKVGERRRPAPGLKAPKKTSHFAGEIGEAGQADRGERRETEGEAEPRAGLGQAAESREAAAVLSRRSCRRWRTAPRSTGRART